MDCTPFTPVDRAGGELGDARLEAWATLPAGLTDRKTTVFAPPVTQATKLASLAVQALIEEVNLTPKPGLVDQRGSGAHADLTLELMHRSARSLFPCFKAMAEASVGMEPSLALRERLASIGRNGEMAMFAVTGGCNTHKGAIWALGLLVAGAVMGDDPADSRAVASLAGAIARFPDRMSPLGASHGIKARQQYGVNGARGEAQEGFPHVVNVGLPTLHDSRSRGLDETCARLDALLAVMSKLDDTCLLHRGGLPMLYRVKDGAGEVLREGGTSTPTGMKSLIQLDAALLEINASPGGSGDLLAATFFLDSLGSMEREQVSFLQNRGSKLWKR